MNEFVGVDRLALALREFASERDWEQFHSPKNLAMALASEVGELLEHFQWLTEQASWLRGASVETHDEVGAEIADILIYLVRLADVLSIDMDAAVGAKLDANARRYTVEESRGSAKKASHPQ